MCGMADSPQRETTDSGHAKGEWHGRSVLTWERVRKIRRRYLEENITQRQLAKEEAVSQTTIHRIITNKNWVDDEYKPRRG